MLASLPQRVLRECSGVWSGDTSLSLRDCLLRSACMQWTQRSLSSPHHFMTHKRYSHDSDQKVLCLCATKRKGAVGWMLRSECRMNHTKAKSMYCTVLYVIVTVGLFFVVRKELSRKMCRRVWRDYVSRQTGAHGGKAQPSGLVDRTGHSYLPSWSKWQRILHEAFVGKCDSCCWPLSLSCWW